MPFWRREEPAHEKLAREGGLVPKQEARPEERRSWHDTLVGIHGVARPREWDAVATVELPGLAGEQIAFVALPDGSLVIEEGPEGNLEPLATAVEGTISPPYRAEAIAQDDRHWAVAANRIEVLELPEVAEGDEIVLTVEDERRELRLDGVDIEGTVPTLEGFAGARYPSFTAQATRIDEDLWEVRVFAL
jgi:hypothetical protein